MAQPDPFGATAVADPDQQLRSALRFDALLMVLFVLLTCAGTFYTLHREVNKVANDPVSQGQRGGAVGTQGLSMAAPANFKRALGIVTADLKPDEVLVNMRLDPTQLYLQMRDTNGNERTFSMGLDYKLHAQADGTDSQDGPLGLHTIDPDAPAALLSAVMQRAHYTAKNLDYFVYNPSTDEDRPSTWEAFFKDVPIHQNSFTADAHGGYVHGTGEPDLVSEARQNAASARGQVTPPGEPVQYSNLTVEKNGKSISYTGRKAVDTANCIKKAQLDTGRIMGCIR